MMASVHVNVINNTNTTYIEKKIHDDWRSCC